LFKDEYSLLIGHPRNLDVKYQITLNIKDTLVGTYNKVNVLIKNKNKYIFDDIIFTNYFIRVFDNQQFFYDYFGNLILRKRFIKTKSISSIKKDRKLVTDKFATFDIETLTIDNVLIPYAICFFDGKDKFSYYLSNIKNYGEMITQAILNILKPKYTGYSIYIHNLSKFDGIFLMKYLANLNHSKYGKVTIKPIMRDNKIIQIKLSFNAGKYSITLLDSLLLLPSSLKELALSFQVDNLKTIFPYKFVNNKYNLDLDLNYIGNLPSYEFFDKKKVSLNEHQMYSETYLQNNLWSLKDETLKYCENDCVCLYQVIEKFNNFIFKKFSLNVFDYPTIPSLTFAIFRSNYLPKLIKQGVNIPIITGQLYNDLKKSFTGGYTNMFIPNNPPGTEVLEYDVNSLYPSSMMKFEMPVSKNGYVINFEGDISQIEQDTFGFFDVNVTTPDFLKHPLLQLRYNTGHGERTIAPLGKFNSMFFSDELKNALKTGYKFNILKGYIFDKEEIFKDYMTTLYQIKENSSKTGAEPNNTRYYIAKLLMNSLYGRFGMSPVFENHLIIDNNELEDYSDKYDVIPKFLGDINDENTKILISYLDYNNIKHANINSLDNKSPNVSIPISSAITAYSRIFMAQFLNKDDIYYMDTDSLYTTKPLDPEFIGTEIGKFKLENIFKEIVFLSPKVYAGITIDGKEISKVKGYKNKISFELLKSLLIKDSSLELNQEKWKKNMDFSNITIKDQLYTLTATENKRQLIFENGILINTKPFVIDTLTPMCDSTISDDSRKDDSSMLDNTIDQDITHEQ
jgi:hypothetical protein